jgi:hypothetical protein
MKTKKKKYYVQDWKDIYPNPLKEGEKPPGEPEVGSLNPFILRGVPLN